MTKFGPKLIFCSIWARPCRLIQCPVGGSVGGCGARAVSRKTPIYFIQYTRITLNMRTLFKISTLPLIDIKMISLSRLANLSHLLLLPTKYNRAIIDDVSPQADENEDQKIIHGDHVEFTTGLPNHNDPV